MSAAPILTPVYILTTALHSALGPVAPLFQGIPAHFWLVSRDGADEALRDGELSGMLISQAQTPLNADGFVRSATVTGVIALRAIALTDDGAQSLYAAAAAAMSAPPVAPAGYRVSWEWLGELVIPPLGGRYTAAATYRIEIRRSA